MAISVRQISEKCLGSRRSLSVVQDLLGYSGGRVPQATSLTQELTRFRDMEHLTLHIKIVSTATWAFASGISIDQMIFSMRLVYGNANVAILVRSTENLLLTDTDIDVGDCAGAATVDTNTLFNNRNSVVSNEIVVYFVRNVFNGGTKSWNGCATHPAGRPGASVASFASRWTLAHEVGHVLGNPHIENETLRFCPTTDRTPPEPSKCILTNL